MNPENTVFDAKRLIGRRFDDSTVQSDMKMWPFNIINDGGKPKIRVEYKSESKTFFPEEISSMVLVKMKEIAEAYLGKVRSMCDLTALCMPPFMPHTKGPSTEEVIRKKYCSYILRGPIPLFAFVCFRLNLPVLRLQMTPRGAGVTPFLPFFLPCPFTLQLLLCLLFPFSFLVRFTYFLFLSTPSLSTRVTTPFPGQRSDLSRRWNLGLVCFTLFYVTCIAWLRFIMVFSCIWFSLVLQCSSSLPLL